MSRDKEIFQCGCCGNISKVGGKYKPGEDDIYVSLWCSKCRDTTLQLYCGDDIDQLYGLYDVTKDSRYY